MARHGATDAAKVRLRGFLLQLLNRSPVLSGCFCMAEAPMLPSPQELRKSQRSSMHRVAEIILTANKQPVRCKIRDMSDGGARLAIAYPLASLPPTFTLVLFRDGSVKRDCQVMWTDGRYVGVKFTSDWYGTLGPKRESNTIAVPRI
jgi:hypothetical protein